MPGPNPSPRPERASNGQTLPKPEEEYLHPSDGGDPDKPNLFVFSNRRDAERVSRELPGKTRVQTRKLDGRQRSVVFERVVSESPRGYESFVVWVSKPILPADSGGGE